MKFNLEKILLVAPVLLLCVFDALSFPALIEKAFLGVGAREEHGKFYVEGRNIIIRRAEGDGIFARMTEPEGSLVFLHAKHSHETFLTVDNLPAEAEVSVKNMEILEGPANGMIRLKMSPPSGKAQSVLTLKPAVNEKDGISFLVYGDSEGKLEYIRVLFESMKAEKANAVFATGDLTLGAKPYAMELFARELGKGPKPMYAAPGNQDLRGGRGVSGFRAVFGGFENGGEKPGGALYHDFIYGNCLFIILDDGLERLGKEQLDWFENTLKEKRKSAKFCFVFSHLPFSDVPEEKYHYPIEEEFVKVRALLKEHSVNAAFASHMHLYHESEEDGIRFYVSGGGGGKPAEADTWKAHYLRVDCGGDTFTCKKVELDLPAPTFFHSHNLRFYASAVLYGVSLWKTLVLLHIIAVLYVPIALLFFLYRKKAAAELKADESKAMQSMKEARETRDNETRS